MRRTTTRGALGTSMLAVVVLAFVALCLPAVARAESGGTTIASAPELPIGTTFVSGVNRHEFWRVTLNAGDKLTIDYQPLNGGWVELRLYRPDVTDFTLGNASPVAYGSTSSRTKFVWTATGRGSWILKISSDHGYKLKAIVKHK